MSLLCILVPFHKLKSSHSLSFESIPASGMHGEQLLVAPGANNHCNPPAPLSFDAAAHVTKTVGQTRECALSNDLCSEWRTPGAAGRICGFMFGRRPSEARINICPDSKPYPVVVAWRVHSTFQLGDIISTGFVWWERWDQHSHRIVKGSPEGPGPNSKDSDPFY